MIDWVSWPLGKNIDKWIIALLKGLAAVKKFSILIEVSLAKIEKVGCLSFFSGMKWTWGTLGLLPGPFLAGFFQASVPNRPRSCLVCPQVHAPDVPAFP